MLIAAAYIDMLGRDWNTGYTQWWRLNE